MVKEEGGVLGSFVFGVLRIGCVERGRRNKVYKVGFIS